MIKEEAILEMENEILDKNSTEKISAIGVEGENTLEGLRLHFEAEAKQEIEELKNFHERQVESGEYGKDVIEKSESLVEQGNLLLKEFLGKVGEFAQEKHALYEEYVLTRGLKSAFGKYNDLINQKGRPLYQKGNPDSRRKAKEVYYKAYVGVLPFLRKYQTVDRSNKEKWKDVKWRVNSVVEKLIDYFLNNAIPERIDIALQLWPYYEAPYTNHVSSHDPQAMIIQKVRSEALRKSAGDDTEGKCQAYFEERLRDFPDLLLCDAMRDSDLKQSDLPGSLPLLEKVPQYLREIRENSLYQRIDHSYPIYNLQIADEYDKGHISKSALDDATRRQIFEAKNKDGEVHGDIIRNLDIFQTDFDELSNEERQEFIEGLNDRFICASRGYVPAAELMSYCRLSEIEFTLLLNRYNKGKKEDDQFSVESLKNYLIKTSPLVQVTNPHIFACQGAKQAELLAKAAAKGENASALDDNLRFFKQILLHREKYPDIDFETAEAQFAALVSRAHTSNLGDRGFRRLEYMKPESLVTNKDLKAQIMQAAELDVGNSIEVLRYNPEYFKGERKKKLEENLVKYGSLWALNYVMSDDMKGIDQSVVKEFLREWPKRDGNDVGMVIMRGYGYLALQMLNCMTSEEKQATFAKMAENEDVAYQNKLMEIRGNKDYGVPNSAISLAILKQAKHNPEHLLERFANRLLDYDLLHDAAEGVEEKYDVLEKIEALSKKISSKANFRAPNYCVAFFAQHPEQVGKFDLILKKLNAFPEHIFSRDQMQKLAAESASDVSEYLDVLSACDELRIKRYGIPTGVKDRWPDKYTGSFRNELMQLALAGETEEADNLVISEFSEKYLTHGSSQNFSLEDQFLKYPPALFAEKNWAEALVYYIAFSEEAPGVDTAQEGLKDKILTLFSGPYRDTCLEKMNGEWLEFLESKETLRLSNKLSALSSAIDSYGGVGNLKHVESLGSLMYRTGEVLRNPITPQRTKEEIKEMLSRQESRMDKERWSQDDRSEFYNLSREIIEAAPSLYSSFAPLLEEFSPKEMKVFMKETFPLYQAQLITIQETAGFDGEVSYSPRDLVLVRQNIKSFAEQLKAQAEEKNLVFEQEKARVIEVIKDSFKERFGLLKVPEEFSKENLRSVQNCVRYLGNISDRNAEKEALIALYLGLELNGEWDKFRQGKNIRSDEYLAEKQHELIKTPLDEKAQSYALPLEIAGIPEEKAERFQEILQEDVMSNMIGNIQTVDVKLGNIKRNIDELADPDIYDDPKEKAVMKILGEEGKAVGGVLAKTYGEATGKKIELADAERVLQKKLASIFGIAQWTADDVKRIQEQIQPFGLISNMIKKMEEENVEGNIIELQSRLLPPDNIIKIFNNLGEDFKQESGALAFGKDLSYLEGLVVKDEGKLTPEDLASVKEYLDSIKDKMKDLETTLDKIKEYFLKMRKSTHIANHEKLKSRLDEVEKIIHSTDSNGMIISRLTKDLNLVIENMRQCLGCLRKEVNNDTNLAFGDYNKFFFINQSEKGKGSVSDEIVFFLPIQKGAGRQEMSFVMDRVYGSKSSDVLISNVLSLYKKLQAIKKEFPEARVSISVTGAALSSVGLNAELVRKRLSEVLPDLKTAEEFFDITAMIPKSSLSDNYIEFGSRDARATGETVFQGVIIE